MLYQYRRVCGVCFILNRRLYISLYQFLLSPFSCDITFFKESPGDGQYIYYNRYETDFSLRTYELIHLKSWQLSLHALYKQYFSLKNCILNFHPFVNGRNKAFFTLIATVNRFSIMRCNFSSTPLTLC